MHSAAPKDMEKSVKEGYEVSDMNPKIIMISIAGLFFLLAGSCAVIVMVIRGFDTSRPALDTTPVSPLATEGIQVPAKPHLQLDPVADRIAIKAENQKKANSYGVVSEEPGMERVHIPVDRAMALVAEGKVPYRQEPAPAAEGAPEDPFAEGEAPAPAEDVLADPFAEETAPAEAPAQP